MKTVQVCAFHHFFKDAAHSRTALIYGLERNPTPHPHPLCPEYKSVHSSAKTPSSWVNRPTILNQEKYKLSGPLCGLHSSNTKIPNFSQFDMDYADRFSILAANQFEYLDGS